MTASEAKWNRRKDARPLEILDAAMNEFAEKGFAETRLAAVATRAGVVKGTIYRYFTNKEELFRAVVTHALSTNLTLLEDAARGADVDFLEVLPAMLKRIADQFTDGRTPRLIRMVLSEGRTFPDLLTIWHDEVVGRAMGFLRTCIARGQATGTIRPGNPTFFVFSVIGPLLLGMLYRDAFSTDGPYAPDLDALATQHADVIRRALRPD